jgi:hypothetical protein
MNRFAASLFLCLLCACGNDGQTPSQSASPPPAPPVRGTESPAPTTVTVLVCTVDLERKPIPGMVPIASRQPNAFDPPTAKGLPTATDGNGSIELPLGQHLFVRAWDTRLQMFANNYLEVDTDVGGQTERTEIMMVKGADISFTLVSETMTPMAGANVDVMLSHPTYGPWWPAKGVATHSGMITIPSVPAGQFNLSVTNPDGGAAKEIQNVKLLPGQLVNLGVVQMKASKSGAGSQ